MKSGLFQAGFQGLKLDTRVVDDAGAFLGILEYMRAMVKTPYVAPGSTIIKVLDISYVIPSKGFLTMAHTRIRGMALNFVLSQVSAAGVKLAMFKAISWGNSPYNKSPLIRML